MTLELILLCHAATRAMKTGSFPDRRRASPSMTHARGSLDRAGTRARVVIASPARVARETAACIARAFDIVPAFDDIDYGRWRGQHDTRDRRARAAACRAWLAIRTRAAWRRKPRDARGARDRRGSGGHRTRMRRHGAVIVVTHAIVVKVPLAHARGDAARVRLCDEFRAALVHGARAAHRPSMPGQSRCRISRPELRTLTIRSKRTAQRMRGPAFHPFRRLRWRTM